MAVDIVKVPGGLQVNGIALLNGKCGCTTIAKCCYSWSKVKKRDSRVYRFLDGMTRTKGKAILTSPV